MQLSLCSQFLQTLTVDHFQEVKRILLRYIRGTLAFGLTYSKPSKTSIIGYSDADWARRLETQRSICGYFIFFGGKFVSWTAKKQPTVYPGRVVNPNIAQWQIRQQKSFG